jgi:VCBS repeat-containing protein
MPIPNYKVFLSSALATGGAVKFTPNAPGDFTPTTAGAPVPPMISGTFDFSGDGRADLIFGAPTDDDKALDAGRVFVEFASLTPGSTLGMGDSLTQLIIDGISAGDQTGSAVGGIADLNGDGKGEILVGAPGTDVGASADAGAAYVVFGKTTGGVDLNDPFTGSGGGYAIKGQSSGDSAGTTIMAISDLNGDGKMDVVVGAPGNDQGGANAGAVYVVWGKSSTGIVNLSTVAAGTGGFKIIGADGGDSAGSAIGVTTDMNGDGKAEILIGTKDNTLGGNNSGAVFVVFGKATGAAVDLNTVAAGTGGFVITGVSQDDAGAAVSGLGDINGDGLGDILIAAPRADHAYVVFGKASGTAIDLANVAGGIGGFEIIAEGVGDLDRVAVAGGKDLNRDGIADIVVGAPNANEAGTETGAVYVIWGGGSGTVDLSLVAQNIGGAKVVGTADSLLGTSVTITSDLNGDGTADLFVGAPGTGESAYVLFSPATWQPDNNVYGTNGDDVMGLGYGSGTHVISEAFDNIIALAGNDTISAAGGNDMIDGSTGADSMSGGAGDDTYYVDNAGDTANEAPGEGIDTVNTSVSFTLGANVENLVLAVTGLTGTGNADDNGITGSAGADTLDGGVGADTLTGNGSDDRYVVDNAGDVVVEAPGGGIDTVAASISYTLGSDVENLVLTSAGLTGTGNTGNNAITGSSGADTLDGGAGIDTLTGGAGDDSYLVDSATDTIVEALNGGTDTVLASVNHTLAANVENLVLSGAGHVGTGNALANSITGTAGADTLDGGTGADTLIGSAGNDSYVVDNAGDTIVEAAGEGTDLVTASFDYTLTEGASIENLTLTGAAHHGTGNSGDNAITGTAGADTLDGAGGTDTLAGGAGDDTYVVDSTTDTLTEAAGAGIDTVISSVNFTLAAGSNIENLTLTGAATHATGNELNNLLTGGAAADVLDGAAGNDKLDGGAGADTMTGGAGDDTFIIDNAGDVVIEGVGGGTDTVVVGSDWTLADNIENVKLVGTGHTLTGNAAANTISGDTGNDIIDGGGGDDIALGGDGNDTLISGSGHDTLAGGSGDDVYKIHGGAAHIEDFQGHDTIDASEATGDSHIDLSGDTASEIENEVCDFGTGGTVTGALNVQFLQDLTGSFADDIANVRTLVPQIVTALQTVSGGAAFGVSTFRDKAYGSFGGAGDWVYITALAVGATPSALTTAYTNFVASSGNDEPEAQIEALMQLGLRANGEVGFQSNSARFAVVFTDAHYHTAADGLAAGILTPNNGDIVLDGGGIGENYPELAQVKAALEAANIIPIFAVTPGLETTYQGLATALGRGTVVTLTANSSNIVSAITTGLTTATTTHIAVAIGGAGNDSLSGNVGDNVLTGNAGADELKGAAGDDSLHGSDGTDTAVFSGAITDYTITHNLDGTVTVADNRPGTDGTDLLDGIEFVRFGADTYTIDGVGTTPPAPAADSVPGLVEAGADGAGVASASGNVLTNDTITAAPGTVTGAHAGASGAFTSVAAATVITGTYGALTINADGSYTYNLDNARPATEALATGDNVSDVFTYQVTDSNGLTGTALITVAIAGSNDTPPTVVTTAGEALLVTAGIASSLDATVLLDNDTVNNGESLTVTAVSNAVGATVALVGNKLVITAAGAASFDYTATSTTGAFAAGHVTVATTATGALTADRVTVGAGFAASDINGQGGNDNLTGNAGRDHLIGDAGNDVLSGGAGIDTMEGGLGNDTYTVDNAGDVIIENAGGGTDTLKVTATSYVLAANVENIMAVGTGSFSGTGNILNNTFTGSAFSDTFAGGLGNDNLKGGAGPDSLSGDGGKDIIDGGTGADTMAGGLGDDKYVVDNGGDVVIEAFGQGTDLVTASISYVLGSDVEKLTLSGAAAIDGTGNALANTLTGNGASNQLFGLDGKDALAGGGGADLLVGGRGADTLTGGAGADTFRFDVLETTALNKDTIKDFVHGTDHFEFSKAAFAAFGPDPLGALSPLEFTMGPVATTADQHLIYNAATGALFYDADGAGGAAQLQIALLANKPVLLDASDFLLVA